MGFLKKLFEKKDCEICGGEIGLLGNRKLVDGDMCKSCAAKLSPWFEDRKESTVAQIKEQLAYREANAAAHANFRATKTLGEYYKMYVMEENGCPTKFVVSIADNYADANADIIKFTDVTTCKTDIRDSRTEVKRKTESGEEVSYNPPRYEFRYEFYVELGIDNPYFDNIRFKVNARTVKLISELQSNRSMSGLGQFLLVDGDFDPSYSPEFRQYMMMCEEISETIQRGQRGAIEQSREIVDPLAEERRKMEFWDAVLAEEDLQKKIAMLEEEYMRIKDDPSDEAHLKRVTETLKACRYSADPAAMAAAMTAQVEQKKETLTAQTAKDASAAKVCPACNAAVTGKFCEYCGTKVE